MARYRGYRLIRVEWHEESSEYEAEARHGFLGTLHGSGTTLPESMESLRRAVESAVPKDETHRDAAPHGQSLSPDGINDLLDGLSFHEPS